VLVLGADAHEHVALAERLAQDAEQLDAPLERGHQLVDLREVLQAVLGDQPRGAVDVQRVLGGVGQLAERRRELVEERALGRRQRRVGQALGEHPRAEAEAGELLVEVGVAQAVRPGSTGRSKVKIRFDTPPVEVMITTISTCGWSVRTSTWRIVAVSIGGAVTTASRFVTWLSASLVARIASSTSRRTSESSSGLRAGGRSTSSCRRRSGSPGRSARGPAEVCGCARKPCSSRRASSLRIVDGRQSSSGSPTASSTRRDAGVEVDSDDLAEDQLLARGRHATSARSVLAATAATLAVTVSRRGPFTRTCAHAGRDPRPSSPRGRTARDSTTTGRSGSADRTVPGARSGRQVVRFEPCPPDTRALQRSRRRPPRRDARPGAEARRRSALAVRPRRCR
jgi:hypothetical protein